MYQTPPQHEGVYIPPVQQPQVSNPQSQGHTGQAIMYQMPPDHSQPGFAGQPPMGQQAQYYVPAGQPIQPVQGQGAPVQPPNEDVSCIRIDSAYLKSGLGGFRVMEFVSILRIWRGNHNLIF